MRPRKLQFCIWRDNQTKPPIFVILCVLCFQRQSFLTFFYKQPTITAKVQKVQVVDKFTYLGSTYSRVMHIDDKVNARIAKASAAFDRLRGSVWDRSGIRLDIKLKVYKAVVLPTLLYAFETWTVYQRHPKSLNHFHTSCLRNLLKIK